MDCRWLEICCIHLKMAVSKTVSTNGKWLTFAGTYAEVINALDSEKLTMSQVVGFAFTSAGSCLVLVHKH